MPKSFPILMILCYASPYSKKLDKYKPGIKYFTHFLACSLIQHVLAPRKVEELEKSHSEVYTIKHNTQIRILLCVSSVNYFKIFTVNSHFISLLPFCTLNLHLTIFQNQSSSQVHHTFHFNAYTFKIHES